MLRALRFIIIAAIFLALAWWIGTIPGTVTAHSGPYTVETSVPAAILGLVLIAILLTIILRVLGGLRRAPGGFGAWRGGRRQKLGDIATQRGIVALSAGDAKAARTEAGRAQKLLGDTPLVLLLVAESARLAGQHEAAQAAFAKLAAQKDTAFLGHRGLLRHSLALDNHDRADIHAAAAEAAYPGSAWLKTKRLSIAVAKQEWSTALNLTRNPPEVAALATAASRASTDVKNALGYAKQAVKADPSLAPAVAAYAAALRQAKRLRAAKKTLLAGWQRAPNPLIAQAYLEPIATPIERAQAAADLAAAKPGDPESELLLAQTSLDAKLTGEAKRHAEAALAAGSNDGRAAAVLAALGEGRSALVPRSAASSGWVCSACHATHAAWQPACPRCQKIGTVLWKPAL
jgi:HemY protein